MFKKTSVMHKDIGEHEHEGFIINSYEVYFVCAKCGMHDWSTPKDYKEPSIKQLLSKDFEHPLIAYFKKKYPKSYLDENG